MIRCLSSAAAFSVNVKATMFSGASLGLRSGAEHVGHAASDNFRLARTGARDELEVAAAMIDGPGLVLRELHAFPPG